MRWTCISRCSRASSSSSSSPSRSPSTPLPTPNHTGRVYIKAAFMRLMNEVYTDIRAVTDPATGGPLLQNYVGTPQNSVMARSTMLGVDRGKFGFAPYLQFQAGRNQLKDSPCLYFYFEPGRSYVLVGPKCDKTKFTTHLLALKDGACVRACVRACVCWGGVGGAAALSVPVAALSSSQPPQIPPAPKTRRHDRPPRRVPLPLQQPRAPAAPRRRPQLGLLDEGLPGQPEPAPGRQGLQRRGARAAGALLDQQRPARQRRRGCVPALNVLPPQSFTRCARSSTLNRVLTPNPITTTNTTHTHTDKGTINPTTGETYNAEFSTRLSKLDRKVSLNKAASIAQLCRCTTLGFKMTLTDADIINEAALIPRIVRFAELALPWLEQCDAGMRRGLAKRGLTLELCRRDMKPANKTTNNARRFASAAEAEPGAGADGGDADSKLPAPQPAKGKRAATELPITSFYKKAKKGDDEEGGAGGAGAGAGATV